MGAADREIERERAQHREQCGHEEELELADALADAVEEASAQDYKCQFGSYTETHMPPGDWQAIKAAIVAYRAVRTP